MSEYHQLIAVEWGPPDSDFQPGWHAIPGGEIVAMQKTDLRLVVEVRGDVVRTELLRGDVLILNLPIHISQAVYLPRMVWREVPQ